MLPLAALTVAGLLAVFGGRQGDFGGGRDDTANQRMQIWVEGIRLIESNPIALLFGIGYEHYSDAVGMVAHNSFVHAYVETGLIGGSLFVAAFVLSGLGILRADRSEWVRGRRDLAILRPFLFALVAGYAAGCYSLSRQYVAPTCITLGIASSFIDLVAGRPPPETGLLPRVAVIGLSAYVLIRVTCFLMVRY